MTTIRATRADRYGLVHPAADAHTLGISSVAQLLEDCGCRATTADAATGKAFECPDEPGSMAHIRKWIRDHRITLLGFSYRLDPDDGAALFARLNRELDAAHLLSRRGGPIKAVFFAGLPATCRKVSRLCPDVAATFRGDETPAETLRALGVDPARWPRETTEGIRYDEDLLSFGRDLIKTGEHLSVKPVDRSGYEGYGARSDTVVARLNHGAARRLPPLTRAHMGPYMADRGEAVRLFLGWTQDLARSGLLDVLSIGTSQLTQSDFGEPWEGKLNGGGVPISSEAEFAAVWQAARPMLVRTYAGTRNVCALARMYEQTLNIAWHALSLWWFSRMDGRGPYPVAENLRQHFDALAYVASTGKPYEPNVPHHFSFRGADDVTCVVSAVLAARAAKAAGIRHLILQTMLNTPRSTWGIQDLAKARATLRLVRELEDDRFRVILQPRAGLDFFSPDPDKARAQLAASTALMDDIEPDNAASPSIIHVVGYSEASHLADPPVVAESIQITRCALEAYRRLRAKGALDDMRRHPEALARTDELLSEARLVLAAIETAVPQPYTPEGLYRALAMGFLPVPDLWECREEFSRAVQWHTRFIRGGVKLVEERGSPISASDRLQRVRSQEPSLTPGGHNAS